jgi:hypothetical protein
MDTLGITLSHGTAPSVLKLWNVGDRIACEVAHSLGSRRMPMSIRT